MFKVSMSFNGKPIRSASELSREIERAARKTIDGQVRQAAGPGVRVSKTAKGYKLQGSERAIERATRRLGVKPTRP